MSRFDVAIAGCGPAGLTFALRAAREGARVAVIGRPAAGARIEGASARVAALLQDLGLDMALLGPRLARAADWP
ncbi:MAG: FAD-binding protein, partial [Rhodobacteraceae bacterium]|nr:FAD-binding protein [Paracoccaceae bacterium]